MIWVIHTITFMLYMNYIYNIYQKFMNFLASFAIGGFNPWAAGVGIGSLVLFGLVGLVAGPNLSKFDTEE